MRHLVALISCGLAAAQPYGEWTRKVGTSCARVTSVGTGVADATACQVQVEAHARCAGPGHAAVFNPSTRECVCATGVCDEVAAAGVDLYLQSFPGRVAKRGICGTPQSCGDFDQHTASSWVYNWGLRDSDWDDLGCGAPQDKMNALGIEYVPMFWNAGGLQPGATPDTSRLGKAKYVIGLNEPERVDQANVSPEAAAEAWVQLEKIAEEWDLKIVGPCMADATGTGYYDAWLTKCNKLYGRPCNFDFSCLHLYHYPEPCQWLPWGCGHSMQGAVERWYNRYGKQLWVTEWACNWWATETAEGKANGAACTPEKHEAIMEQQVPLLENSEYVFRQSFYIVHDGAYPTSGNSMNKAKWGAGMSGHSCPNQKWLGQTSTRECKDLAAADADCFAPLTVVYQRDGDRNCYCATDACAAPKVEGWLNIMRDQGEDPAELTPLGVRYNSLPGATPPPTPAPATPAPATPAPATPTPDTPPSTPSPASASPAPTTPTPTPPASATPAPTSASASPAPATPAPTTPAPATPAPATPTSATPMPATPAPTTPTSATPMPATPAPTTPVPDTPAPVPASSAPATNATGTADPPGANAGAETEANADDGFPIWVVVVVAAVLGVGVLTVLVARRQRQQAHFDDDEQNEKGRGEPVVAYSEMAGMRPHEVATTPPFVPEGIKGL